MASVRAVPIELDQRMEKKDPIHGGTLEFMEYSGSNKYIPINIVKPISGSNKYIPNKYIETNTYIP